MLLNIKFILVILEVFYFNNGWLNVEVFLNIFFIFLIFDMLLKIKLLNFLVFLNIFFIVLILVVFKWFKFVLKNLVFLNIVVIFVIFFCIIK